MRRRHLIEGDHDPHLALGHDEGPGLGAQRVVQGHIHHGVAVHALGKIFLFFLGGGFLRTCSAITPSGQFLA